MKTAFSIALSVVGSALIGYLGTVVYVAVAIARLGYGKWTPGAE